MRAIALLLLVLSASVAAAAEGPVPPCGGAAPVPAYAPAGSQPAVTVWTPRELEDPGLTHVQLAAGQPLDRWRPPPCTDWNELPFTIALAARFHHAGGPEELLARFAAPSALADLRYWAASRQQWETLFDEVHAVAGPDSREPRPDPGPDELGPGRDLHSLQDVAGPVGAAVYRTRVVEQTPDRLVVEIENVTSARALGLFPLRPGTLRFVYFLERLPDQEEVWGYYGLMGLTTIPDSARTYVNRAAAIFRHVAAIPDTQEPPVWP